MVYETKTSDDTLVSWQRSVNVFIVEVPERDELMGSKGDKGLGRDISGAREPICHGSDIRNRRRCLDHPSSGFFGGCKGKEIEWRRAIIL